MIDDILIRFVLALLPIIWLVIALCILKMSAHIASIGAFVVAFIEAMVIWNLTLSNTITASLEGFAMALWPIILVIIAAVFTYNLTVHTKAMDIIKNMLTSVSMDSRVLVILIGWCFGGFLEGMAGFGVAIAIPASMLYALGINPILAILACLVANGCPTMFGSIGIPTTTLAGITGLDSSILAFVQTIQVSPLLFISPFLMVMLVSGGIKGMKGLWGFTLVSSLSFVLPEIIAAKFIGSDLCVIIASIVSLLSTFAYANFILKKKEVKDEYRLAIKNDIKITTKDALVAWSPFILIFVLLLATSKLFPMINQPLSAIKSSIYIYNGPNASPYTFTWINTPGVLILISGLIGGFIQKCSIKEIFTVLLATIKQMSKTICTMLGVLGCAKIMSYSGMISDISTFFVTTLGPLFPFASPLIGALGTFVTGSGTSSEVLFGNVQLNAATKLGINEYWLVGANSLGTSAGKMLAPQSIAIGCAACNQEGQDAILLKRIAPYAFGYVIVGALITYFGSFLANYLI